MSVNGSNVRATSANPGEQTACESQQNKQTGSRERVIGGKNTGSKNRIELFERTRQAGKSRVGMCQCLSSFAC